MNTIDIDTGGTFTDGVFRVGGSVVTVKVDTTPHDPVKCFVECLEAGAHLLGEDLMALLEATDIIRYSTTAATNTIIQRRGARIGLLVTEGAERDLYGQGTEAPIWKFLDGALVRGIREEVDARGVVKVELDADGFRLAAEELLDGGARLLVVAFSHAALNPTNELRARELFEMWFPTYYLGRPFLLLSHHVTSRGTEAERLNAAVLSGYLHRELVGYLYRCDDTVRRRGFRHPLLIVHSTGGLARVAKTKALNTYNSGPTAGVFGAARLARRYGFPRVVTMDMGGTSTDVAFIEQGEVPLSFRAEIDCVRVSLPMIDVMGLGGGGGSIVSVEGATLRVGPESAGAIPGPVCYDLGNNVPTVTDADVVLNLIAADNFLGGRRRINLDRARQAIEQTVATPMEESVDEAALRIRKVLAENLAGAIQIEAEKRAFSVRDAVLFAYGGAGPVHAADIARALGISVFYVFPQSSVFSAAGSSAMNIEHYYERRVRPQGAGSFPQALARVTSELAIRAQRDIRGEGFSRSAAKFQFVLETLDGETREFNPASDVKVAELAGHEDGLVRLTTTIQSGDQVEEDIFTPPSRDSQTSPTHREIAWESGRKMTPVYSLWGVGVGEQCSGPAVVETGETACVIPKGWSAEKDDAGALRVQRRTERRI